MAPVTANVNRILDTPDRVGTSGAEHDLGARRMSKKTLTIALPECEAGLPADVRVGHQRTDAMIVRGKVIA
jgi:hypothetical protein